MVGGRNIVWREGLEAISELLQVVMVWGIWLDLCSNHGRCERIKENNMMYLVALFDRRSTQLEGVSSTEIWAQT